MRRAGERGRESLNKLCKYWHYVVQSSKVSKLMPQPDYKMLYRFIQFIDPSYSKVTFSKTQTQDLLITTANSNIHIKTMQVTSQTVKTRVSLFFSPASFGFNLGHKVSSFLLSI
jgi:hypothetical protein